MLRLSRAQENPILSPTQNFWEDFLVFNPGAVMKDGKVHLLYRAQGKKDGISRFGLATSTDGIHFDRLSHPVYAGTPHHQWEALGVEDPRVVEIDNTFYITYTAVSEIEDADVNSSWVEQIAKLPQIALATTRDFHHFIDYDIIIPNIPGKNTSLFPKKINNEYWLIYRQEGGTTFFSKSPIFTHWPEPLPVFNKRPGFWDNSRTGIGAPPIETDKGWLLFYHGVNEHHAYKLGIMFLDLYNPTKILYRSPEPVFEPLEAYEKNGFIPNAVFTCGAVEKDDKYYIYYGASDEVIGLATVEKKDVMRLLE